MQKRASVWDPNLLSGKVVQLLVQLACMAFVSGPLQRVAQPLRCAYLVTGFVTKKVYVVNNQLTGSESALTVTGC